MIYVSQQGYPKIGEGWFTHERTKKSLIGTIDLATKRCEYLCIGEDDGVPNITIRATEYTPDEHKDLKSCTVIDFPGLIGWRIHSVTISKYTMYMAFVKL